MRTARETGERSWSIVGGNIRDDMSETMTALIAQKGEYTLETVTPAGVRQYERVNILSKLGGPEDQHNREIYKIGLSRHPSLATWATAPRRIAAIWLFPLKNRGR